MIRRKERPPAPELQHPCGLDLGGRDNVQLRLEGSTKEVMETGKTRLLVAFAVFALAFSVVGLRLVDLALLSETKEPRLTASETSAPVALPRADIVDRNGEILATTLPSASIYADPAKVIDPEGTAEALVSVLPEESVAELAAKLGSDRGFVWIKRNISPREQQLVNDLGLPGVDFIREERRVYPHGELASHVIGFTNIDNRGLAGIELSLDELLRGASKPLQLSLDLRVQHVLAEQLQWAMTEWRGIGAAGLVMDIHTGEVIAMVSLPSYDPSQPGQASEDARFNRATLGVYELGSIFKVFTAAMALQANVVELEDRFDVSRPIRVAGYSIQDFKPKDRALSVPEILLYSSNIGTVQMAMELGTQRQQAYLEELGLLRAASIELPEVGQPQSPRTWREINTMTISYGHGIAVTPLQVVRAMSAVINGGALPPLTLIKRNDGEAVPARQIFDEITSEKMRWMTRLVVRHGTGRNANAEGYLVGGKTGTADKLAETGGYADDARIASFLAGFPMDDPRYVVFAMVDEPKPTEYSHGYATGGWVAAPVVKEVVARIAPLLGIQPRPAEEDGGDIENALMIPAHLRTGALALN